MTRKPIDKTVQGEGDYIAGRCYQNAAPQSDKEANEMKRAEQAGASRSKGEGSLVSNKKGKGV